MMRPADDGGTSRETCKVCAVAHLVTLCGLRAHPSRQAHARKRATACHAGCYALRPSEVGTLFPLAARKRGAAKRKSDGRKGVPPARLLRSQARKIAPRVPPSPCYSLHLTMPVSPQPPANQRPALKMRHVYFRRFAPENRRFPPETPLLTHCYRPAFERNLRRRRKRNYNPTACCATKASTTSTIFCCCRFGRRDTASNARRALPIGPLFCRFSLPFP